MTSNFAWRACLGALAALATLAAGCELEGCDDGLSNLLPLSIASAAPALRWSWPSRNPSANTTHLCTAAIDDNGSPVVCTGSEGYMAGWRSNGSVGWLTRNLSGTAAFSCLSDAGDSIGFDGHELVGVLSDGSSFGPPIPMCDAGVCLKPSFSLTYTAQDIIPLLSRGCTSGGKPNSRCSLLATYLTNGVPHASEPLTSPPLPPWANPSGPENPVPGNFCPLSMAVINGTRIYFVSRFEGADAPSEKGRCRLWGVDVVSRLSNRIVVAWVFDFFCASVPHPQDGAATSPLLLAKRSDGSGTLVLGGSTASEDGRGLLFVTDQGAKPSLLKEAKLEAGVRIGALSYMDAESSVWAVPVHSASALGTLSISRFGVEGRALQPLSISAPLQSPLMVTSLAAGPPALLFVSGGKLRAVVPSKASGAGGPPRQVFAVEHPSFAAPAFRPTSQVLLLRGAAGNVSTAGLVVVPTAAGITAFGA